MKKFLWQCILLILPVFAFAQKEAPLFKDFRKKLLDIANSVKFNDHAYAMLIVTDEENSELAAVDNKMHELWRTPLKGVGFRVGKFKGNLLAYTVNTQGKQKTFTAFLVDPNTGKVLNQKVVYDSKTDYEEQIFPVFTEDGNIARLVSRETGIDKLDHFKKSNHFNATKDLTIVDIDDKLGATVSKPVMPDGIFINLVYNQLGDIFILTVPQDATLKLSKYDYGKTTASSSIGQDWSMRNKSDAYSTSLTSSKTENNVAYIALIHENKNKENVLALCKFDFNIKSAQAASVPFDDAHIKSLEKNFVPLHKNMDKPDMVRSGIFEVRHLEEYNSILLVMVSGHSMGSYHIGGNPTYTGLAFSEGGAIDVLGFDLKLTPKFEQVVPVLYRERILTDWYHGEGNYFNMLAANTKHTNGTYFAQIDLVTGKLVKFNLCIKEFIDTDALWFKDVFIIPVIRDPGIIISHGQVLDLQLDSY